MKRVLVSLLVVVALGSPSKPATAEKLVISTGPKAGGYYYIGKRLESAIIVHNQQPPPVEVVTSKGSMENLARLHDPDSPVNVTLTQKDALQYYLSDRPSLATDLIMLGDVGRECALLITAATSPIQSAADLKDERGLTLAVNSFDSGAAVLWMNLTSHDRAFGHTPASPTGVMEGMLQLDVGGEFSKIAAVLVVQRPRRASSPVKLLLESPEKYRLVPITESDLESPPSPDGALYSFEQVEVGGSQSREPLSVKTICTQGLLVASSAKISAQNRELLSALMLERASEIKGRE